jgi:hypothetical protein
MKPVPPSPLRNPNLVRRSLGEGGSALGRWLPDMDLNHDKQIQSLLCYRYTIGQTEGTRLVISSPESSHC